MDTRQITCAACGAVVGEDGRLPLQCPSCGELLLIDDEKEEEAAPAEGEVGELEEVRIRRIVRERRAQVRTRGYLIVVLLACVIGTAQLAMRLAASGKSTEWVGYAAGILLLIIIAWGMVGRLRELSRKMKESALPEPSTPPDFSGLSDGSHHAENLKQMGE